MTGLTIVVFMFSCFPVFQLKVQVGTLTCYTTQQENMKTGKQLPCIRDGINIKMVSCFPACWIYYYNGFLFPAAWTYYYNDFLFSNFLEHRKPL